MLESGEYKKAIVVLTRALEISPRDLDALSHRAAAYHRNGEFDAAIADLAQCIDDGYATLPLIGLGPSLYYRRGSAYLDKGDVAQGMADYELSIQASLDLLAKLRNQEPRKSIPGHQMSFATIDLSVLPLQNLMVTYATRAAVYGTMGHVEKQQSDLEQYQRYRAELETTQPRR
jgi:tetratricopeptide (TPR) repeat protein